MRWPIWSVLTSIFIGILIVIVFPHRPTFLYYVAGVVVTLLCIFVEEWLL